MMIYDVVPIKMEDSSGGILSINNKDLSHDLTSKVGTMDG